MLATFLRIVGQNNIFSVIRDTFGRSHFTASRSFNKVLKALNTLAPEMLVKPGSAVPAKIRKVQGFTLTLRTASERSMAHIFQQWLTGPAPNFPEPETNPAETPASHPRRVHSLKLCPLLPERIYGTRLSAKISAESPLQIEHSPKFPPA
ncbi:unnamed protein product [Prunus armeniaca]